MMTCVVGGVLAAQDGGGLMLYIVSSSSMKMLQSVPILTIFTLRPPSDLCLTISAKSLICKANLHTRDRVTQRIMRDHVRHVSAGASVSKHGAGVGHWGVYALLYTTSHTD